MPQLIVATRNLKKLAEIEDLIRLPGVSLRAAGEFADAPEIVEDGSTFSENAAKKAMETAGALGHWSLGEDSGLCVDALDGRPGIYSARFAGEPSHDERNNAKLVEELADVPAERRGAHYVCSVAVADPSGAVRLTAEGRCQGRIVRQRRGGGGFGYDPYFLLREYHRTFGELPAVVKRHLSHRARAIGRLRPGLRELLTSAS